eukprot:gnl/TRDRNA2_/TRDRNA2_133684_c0_seq1.p1 gnl/TRDRNA2_/TRDRNA2_133684_c0~~gnl/TRDRNA2_/TRDRNA2_133684_c0_seq1.p1  ORF type:complete len:476 (-),score=48.99 gnl/TRDRNA2_/TRDRNA2_133684_c0_seq1:140-1567(-)
MQMHKQLQKKFMLPGLMPSTGLYLQDVMLLPKENSIALLVYGEWSLEALQVHDDSVKAAAVLHAQNATQQVAELRLILPSVADSHSFKCAAVDNSEAGANFVGAGHIFVCRAEGVDLDEKLEEIQRSKGSVLEVQLGSEVVEVSARSLSASRDISTPRAYSTSRSSGRSSGWTASVVIPLFGHLPPYLEESIQYFNASGMSHVYLGIFNEAVGGSLRSALDPHIKNGFVSLLELDARQGNFDWRQVKGNNKHPDRAINIPKTIINDWALYHSKSFDDLLLIHDYDELVVPTRIATVPTVIQELVESRNGFKLDDLCFLKLCPLVTYARRGHSEVRGEQSRAEDFPLMDGGSDSPQKIWRLGDSDCLEGGYANIHAKAIAVTRTTYKSGLHEPSACSVPREKGGAGHYVTLSRAGTLHLQHFVELYTPSSNYKKKYITPERMYLKQLLDQTDHRQQVSTFTRVWGSMLNRSAIKQQ